MGVETEMSVRPPGGKRPKEQVQFRGDAENKTWAERFVGKAGKLPTFSEVCDWVFGNGRKHIEAFTDLEPEIEEFRAEQRLSEVEALRRLVRSGLAAEKKAKK